MSYAPLKHEGIMSNHKMLTTKKRIVPAFKQNKREIHNSISVKEISVMLSMLALLCFTIFHKFILGFSVYLFKDMGSDTLNSYYPSFINISGMLR